MKNKWPEKKYWKGKLRDKQSESIAARMLHNEAIDACLAAVLDAVSVERLHKIISASTLGNYAANYEWTMMLADELREFILSDMGIKEEG